MANELVIKITGDVEDYRSALRQATGETEALADQSSKIALKAGVAFAALTAEVILSVKAFNEEQRALSEVNVALQNQGIYTAELAAEYRKVAVAIEAKTGVDADQISAAQASAQATAGQIALTGELTQAVVDFAAKQRTDVATAYSLVAKAIAGQEGALSRYGVVIDQGLTKQERLAQIQQKLQVAVGGFAEAQAKASGSTILLEHAFENLQKRIGQRLAPAFDTAVKASTSFVHWVEKSEGATNLLVASISGLAVASGAALAIVAAQKAMVLFQGAALAAAAAQELLNVAAGVRAVAAMGGLSSAIPALVTGLMNLSLATKVLVGATGLGLLVLVATEIYLNWNRIFPRLTVIWQGFVTSVLEGSKALAEVFAGVFTFDPARVKAGIDGYIKALKDGFKQATQTLENQDVPLPGPDQDPAKLKAAAEAAAREKRQEAARLAGRKASLELLRLEEEKASKDMIELKKREVETLKQLETETDSGRVGFLQRRIAETRRLQDEQAAIDKERRQILNEEILAENEAFQQMEEAQKRDFIARNQQILEQEVLTAKQAQEKVAKDRAETQIKANNQFLIEQQKFGTAYATINRAMNTEVVQGSKQAFGELAALQASSSNTLKSIGKTAAIANIIIQTATAAMNIYAGFSTIPIVGPALGIAGAAAAVAFGAEQIGKVKGAAEGGLLTGGVPGVDSIPVMAQQGELVAPTKNFEEVIGSVRAGREAKNFTGSSATLTEETGQKILAQLEAIGDRIQTPTVIQNTFEGDVLAEPAYVDKLLQGISDAFEFRNAKVVGVNA